MKTFTKRTSFSKRRSKRRTSFPLVAVVPKRLKARYTSEKALNRGETAQAQSKIKNLNKSTPKSRGTIDYKNVILLRKLITAEGKIIPRRINKLTAKQQRYTSKAIKIARVMGLLPFINKSRSLTV